METEINFFAINNEPTPFHCKFNHYVDSPVTVFGSFTFDECAKIQGVTNIAYTFIQQPIPCSRCGYTNHSIEKCVARRNVHRELILSPPTTPEKSRNMLLYPVSPSNSPRHNDVHYYNPQLIKNGWHSADKTDYNQFMFSHDEVQDWIEEEQHLQQPHYYEHSPDIQNEFQVVYVPLLVKKHQSIISSRLTEQQEICYALKYNYAVTEYMMGRQALFHI